MKIRKLLGRTALITTLLAGLHASADPVLIVSDGITTFGPITLSGGSGVFSIPLDSSWSLVAAIGESKPVFGSAVSPNMELNIQAVSLGSTNALTVILSDNNFGPTFGNNNMLAELNGQSIGLSGDLVTFDTYYDTNNTPAALTTLLTGSGSMVPNGGDGYASSETSSLALAGPYSLSEVVQIAGGQDATYSLLADLQSAIAVVTPPTNAVACPNGTASFGITANGTDLTYQWYQSTNLLSGQTNDTLVLTNVTADDAGIYSVVVGNGNGAEITNSAFLTVNQDVSVSPLANVTNSIGSSVTFTAIASGTGPFSYQWYDGANELADQTNSTLTLTNLQPTNSGTYSVLVTGACGTGATAAAVLTVLQPPIVSICYPTNGEVFVAPATFNVMAMASSPDGTITNVEFFSSTNGVDFVFLGQTNNTPYLTIASNLAAGTYTFIAEAADNFGVTAQSAPVTVDVVPPQPPTVTVLGHLTLNVQDGYQWLSNVVCNPVESYAQSVRVYIHNITNSAIQVVNASGTNDGLPYVESPAAIRPGACWTNVIMFYDPLQLAFYPTLTVELVSPPNAAGNPTGTVVPMILSKMLANGTFLIEFASTNGATYYVQYSSDMVNWNTSFPAILGTGQYMQWIDSGPPVTASLPAANVARYYRVILAQ